ncbi:hypothetical protein HYH03_010610 [Edaphochlamys debaryana]|uniref:Ubiquitin-like protease family profile domain-containing protein n=1 Tax=Edaphochlamys debaryana TaxID=47281 RepID=A0A836BX78_9CHLO|nr:hypothetical protein HYH03_010610 [Edaphochlamys debaryana]|eukprot:KAG2490933.1 hypothetical protein HYH03_010610 [Edaphochlamys debaryana]
MLTGNIIEKSKWSVVILQDTPQQTNDIDCGVFVMSFIYSLVSRTAMPLATQADIERLRVQYKSFIEQELLHKPEPEPLVTDYTKQVWSLARSWLLQMR